MNPPDKPTFDDIFAVMAAASVGVTSARVTLPDDLDLDDTPTRFAVALNLLLDDLGQRTVELQAEFDARLQVEQQLRQSQKLEAIGQLAGGVAHDFNNMLSVVLSYSHLILDDLKPGDPMRGDIEEISKAGVRAATLTRQLLAFSRQQVLELSVVNLNDILEGMRNMLVRLIGEHIELVARPAADLGVARLDPAQIEQVLMNLVLNARDAIADGGKITIETGNVDLDAAYAHTHHGVIPGAHVMLAVSDTGAGMDAHTQARIFEPFFTTKTRERGTGLGLSTVLGIVKQSGGSIWLYSEPGEGSTFKVYFPRTDGVQPQGTPVSSGLVTGPRATETILLVEDEAQVRTVAREILEREGYVVLEARGGEEALGLLAGHPGRVDLCLTDVVMPRMSGRQLVERLLAQRPGLKVLYMSGYTDNSIVHHGILDAGIAFLQKPITPAALLRKVRSVLDGQAW